jgi:lysylphosphatidylglycerol synthetase-like protein (DUF2156 family)
MISAFFSRDVRFARLGAFAALLTALFALVVALALPASARTHNHGMNVVLSNAYLGDGDVVRGDLNIVLGKATCSAGAEIEGNVNYALGSFEQLDGCVVRGTINDAFDGESVSTFVPWVSPQMGAGMLLEENRRVLGHLAYGIVVLFAFLLFPVRVRVALDRVEHHPGLSAAVGTLAIVAVIPVAVLLVLSIIGIPLVVVEVAALFAGLWIGQAAVAILVGRRLFELLRPHTTPSPLGALVLGLVVVGAAEILPGVGWFVTALVCLVGLGAAILAFVRETAFAGFMHVPAPPPPGAPPAPGSTPMRPA